MHNACRYNIRYPTSNYWHAGGAAERQVKQMAASLPYQLQLPTPCTGEYRTYNNNNMNESECF